MEAFTALIRNEITEMHQGAFLAALTAKGETAGEVAGAWEAGDKLDNGGERVKLSFGAGDAIRRRRECLSCGRRFTSYERIEEVPQENVRVAFLIEGSEVD